MNESYNEKIHSLNSVEEQFQEREIMGEIYEEASKEINSKSEKEVHMKQITEDLSSCSVSSSSSSCCEVALGSNHINDSPNFAENLNVSNEG